jgi:hypothetical protein
MTQVGQTRRGVLGRLRRRCFGIDDAEATCARRGFRTTDEFARQRIEQIGRTFLDGYHAALEAPRLTALAARLGEVDSERRGFAFEGAAMALALLDLLVPWRANRWQSFLAQHARAHRYMVHVGFGWALARLHRPVEPALRRLDPLLGWLAVDGLGFHQGYFYGSQALYGQTASATLTGYARRAFDQGLGRSLWFMFGTDVSAMAAALQDVPPQRRPDLWSGIGLAATYAGGTRAANLTELRHASGAQAAHVAQGAAFAAAARHRSGALTHYTDQACQILCGLSAQAAAEVTQATLVGLPGDAFEPAYEVWRQRIRAYFAAARDEVAV